jgi:tRNA-splicing ligase RtcB
MISQKNLKKINEYLWEIPKNFRKDMLVPARIYADSKMLTNIFKDKSLEQLINLTTLPGVENYAIVMPDAHEGYGSPIGGIFATRLIDGVISPGAIGYDENCGVRLLYTQYTEKELRPYLEKLATTIQKNIPSGLGQGHFKKLNIQELNKILENGAQTLIKEGYGLKEDIENCESNGKLPWANPNYVSRTAKQRGQNQIGTLGSGNHFLEIQKVEQIFNPEIAQIFGLFENQITIMIHTGSRGLGHQIATDYIKLMLKIMPKYKIVLRDQELACAPFNSPEGQQFWQALACGANFAWANRQMITHYLRQSWNETIKDGRNAQDNALRVLYDVAHNIAKIENGLIVHRKGATRALPPYHAEIPTKYQKAGQPVLIPGSMGTASYILSGTETAKNSFYSTCHGAGRQLSRRQALKILNSQQILKELTLKKIIVKCYSTKGLVEEAPQSYKNIDSVIEIIHKAGLSQKIARLVPLAVIKGE